jgi:hypothetical protein
MRLFTIETRRQLITTETKGELNWNQNQNNSQRERENEKEKAMNGRTKKNLVRKDRTEWKKNIH